MKPRTAKILAAAAVALLLAAIALLAAALYRKYSGNEKQKDMINPTKKRYRVTSPFGQRTAPAAGASSFHNGIDIAAPMDTEVLAPADSTVTEVSTHPTGGRQLILLTDTGLRIGFAHLSRTLFTPGTKVKMGVTVARSGSSGVSTGPHLHITVTENGRKVDPLRYFDY